MDESYRFDAFLSYSHLDLKWAKWLQNRLEGWKIPVDICKEKAIDGRNLKIFRDQTDLAGVELREAIRRELEASRYLIVLCTPHSASSPWVAEEIAYFKSLGRGDYIVPFIVEGEPETDKAERECFPEELRNVDGKHFLGANVQELGRNKAFLRLLSIILKVRFDRLVDRDRRNRFRRRFVIGCCVMIVAAVAGGLLWQNYLEKQKNLSLTYELFGSAMLHYADENESDEVYVQLLMESAAVGNGDACTVLSSCYEEGRGVEVDETKAFQWAQKGAQLGSTMAMIKLSNCYSTGIGTEVDEAQAFYWQLKAAEAGMPQAMSVVGLRYEKGIGVEADPNHAFFWYSKGAEQGDSEAMVNLSMCYLRGVGTEEKPEESLSWMTRAAELGDVDGMYLLGVIYQNGYGTDEQPEEALRWYRKAAEAGSADAMYQVGWCLENRYGTENPAIDWYERAAEAGSEKALERLQEIDEGLQKDSEMETSGQNVN